MSAPRKVEASDVSAGLYAAWDAAAKSAYSDPASNYDVIRDGSMALMQNPKYLEVIASTINEAMKEPPSPIE